MRTAVGSCALALVLLALVSCAAQGPEFATAAASLPPVPQGEARVYFYRWLEPYETVAESAVMLNGARVGVSQTGAVLYRDVAPGQYTISVGSAGIYPDQFKTVVLSPGQTAYVRIESLRSWCNDAGGGLTGGGTSEGCYDTFVVDLIDPAVAKAEMQNLRFIQG
jgi:Protein of unknown function (DUF2846)